MKGVYDRITHGLHIGSQKNYMEISREGEITYRGKGTTWDDIQNSLIGRRLSSVAGGVDYNYANGSITFKPGGVISDIDDTVSWSVQYPHKAVVDGTLNVHLHWEQVDATPRQFTLWYRLQPVGAPKETDWTEVIVSTADSLIEYTSGVLNQITPLAVIDMTGAGLSCIVQMRLARTDAVAGNIEAQFADAHYAIDSTGSSEEFVK